MNTKNLVTMFGLMTIFLFAISLVSAVLPENVTIDVTQNIPGSVTPGSSYVMKLNITNNNAEDFKVEFYNKTALTTMSWSILPTANATLVNGTEQDYSLTLKIGSDFNGTKTQKLRVNFYNATNDLVGNDTSESFTVSYTIPVTPTATFCEDEGHPEDHTNNTLDISDFEINNLGNGDDEEWELLDEIEIEVTVENTDDDDSVKDVMVEIKILKNGNDVTDDFDFDDEEIDLGKIGDDDEETAVFRIPEVPVDMDDGDYEIYVMVYSEDGDTEEYCISESDDMDNDVYQLVEIVMEDTGIILKDDVTVDTVCGNIVEIRLDAYNTGDNDEDKVLINLYDSELGIDEYVVLDDFRDGKKQEVIFNFRMPESLSKTSYRLDVYTFWDWDDDEDELDENAYDENSFDDLDEDYYVYLNVLSCQASEPTIVLEDIDDAVEGEEMEVVVSVTNNGDSVDNFVVALIGDWFEDVDAEAVLILNAGETEEVTLIITPTELGDKELVIRTVNSGSVVEKTKDVEVLASNWFNVNNGFLYWVAGIMAILILFLLVVISAVSQSRRRSA